MKKVYFAGKFNKLPNKKLPLAKRLVNDFRTKLLGAPERLVYAKENPIIYHRFVYTGPFYSEQASNGDYTSTDCETVLRAEAEAISKSDIYLVVFGDQFSVGSVVELGWALAQNKEIIILYREESSVYAIRSEYWFAIADALSKSTKVKLFPYRRKNVPLSLINKALSEVM